MEKSPAEVFSISKRLGGPRQERKELLTRENEDRRERQLRPEVSNGAFQKSVDKHGSEVADRLLMTMAIEVSISIRSLLGFAPRAVSSTTRRKKWLRKAISEIAVCRLCGRMLRAWILARKKSMWRFLTTAMRTRCVASVHSRAACEDWLIGCRSAGSRRWRWNRLVSTGFPFFRSWNHEDLKYF